MKLIIVLAAVLAIALARPQSRDGDAQIVRQETDNIGVGGFKFGYATSNGIAADATGQVVNEGREDEDLVVTGQFEYTGLDGVRYLTTYIADKDGFRPQGTHIPQRR